MKTPPSPPSFRPARCCGTCRHWVWGYEGEGNCQKYPDSINSKHSNSSTYICNDFKAKEK